MIRRLFYCLLFLVFMILLMNFVFDELSSNPKVVDLRLCGNEFVIQQGGLVVTNYPHVITGVNIKQEDAKLDSPYNYGLGGEKITIKSVINTYGSIDGEFKIGEWTSVNIIAQQVLGESRALLPTGTYSSIKAGIIKEICVEQNHDIKIRR